MVNRRFVALRLFAVTLVILGVALSIWPLEAAVQLFDVSESPMLVNHTDRQIEIPQFDSALGTLQSVTIDLQGTGNFLQRFAHFGAGHGQLVVQQNLSLVLETLNNHSLISLNQTETHLYSFSGLDSGSGFAGHFETPRAYGVTAAGTRTLDSESDLMQFTGSGFVDLVLSARGGLRDHFIRGGGLLEGLLTAGANINVKYSYTPVSQVVVPVPEVAPWLAGAVALLGLALTKGSRQNPGGRSPAS
jgi:hypothetical protein